MPFNTCNTWQNRNLRFYRDYRRRVYHKVFRAVKSWEI